MQFIEKINRIKKAVHSEMDFSDYNATLCRNICNCYSHAIGSTLPIEEIYRIGAICSKKDIAEKYVSVDEIVSLLYEDLRTLNLGIEEYNGDELKNNEYLIKLYIKRYREWLISDYHFIRCDNRGWTEKWRHYKEAVIDEDYYTFFPWEEVGIYKITK
ncbi:MAG: hypothetical protein HFJ43_01780 [Clostridia bacterium]|nr:hypothetical protein [Clostridia bacterium]